MIDPAEAAVRISGLTKSFGNVHAVEDLDLAVPRGGFLAVLGPSGSGKTTLLRLIAGFERPDRGTVTIAGRLVADSRRSLPPERRRVGMVFQETTLFPHLDVAANVGFGLPRAGRQARVGELLTLVGLGSLARRMPHQLSGGQQQRVALARALAPRPELICLDEPFSGLEATLRQQLRADVRDILRAAGATTIFVTHDRDEALSIADVVAVMRAGRVEQVATPAELYLRPVTRFVARFIGAANLVAGRVVGGQIATALGDFRPVDAALDEGARVDALLRPEQLHLVPLDRHAVGAESGPFRIVERSFHGPMVRYRVRDREGTELEVTAPSTSALPLDAAVGVHARARQVPVYLGDDASSAARVSRGAAGP